jgi:hypothetical protein
MPPSSTGAAVKGNRRFVLKGDDVAATTGRLRSRHGDLSHLVPHRITLMGAGQFLSMENLLTCQHVVKQSNPWTELLSNEQLSGCNWQERSEPFSENESESESEDWALSLTANDDYLDYFFVHGQCYAESSTANFIGVAAKLLDDLIDSPSRTRNSIFRNLVKYVTADEVLSNALTRYEKTQVVDYLNFAASILDVKGASGWPALQNLAASRRIECEPFVKVIAKGAGASPGQLQVALIQLAKNPDTSVRWRLLEHLPQVPADIRSKVLKILSTDADREIQSDALASLENS